MPLEGQRDGERVAPCGAGLARRATVHNLDNERDCCRSTPATLVRPVGGQTGAESREPKASSQGLVRREPRACLHSLVSVVVLSCAEAVDDVGVCWSCPAKSTLSYMPAAQRCPKALQRACALGEQPHEQEPSPGVVGQPENSALECCFQKLAQLEAKHKRKHLSSRLSSCKNGDQAW